MHSLVWFVNGLSRMCSHASSFAAQITLFFYYLIAFLAMKTLFTVVAVPYNCKEYGFMYIYDCICLYEKI